MNELHWPYTASEIKRIQEILPPDNERAVALVVEGAKQYAWMAEGRAQHKPNPKREIKKLSAAILEMRRALQLSVRAENHLSDHYRQSPAYDEPMHVVNFWDALRRFEVENAEGFKKAPSAPPGAISRNFERSLEKHLRCAFDLARSKKSSRGWPAFLSACVEPLQKRHAMPGIQLKSWQDKSRKNLARKKPD
jgi:hypothetical protein